jgi:hypothetical protein
MPEAETQTEKPRGLYTDGWNSFWHIVFGILASKFPRIIVLLFMGYQLFDTEELNVCVDILEFMYGFTLGMCLQLIM